MLLMISYCIPTAVLQTCFQMKMLSVHPHFWKYGMSLNHQGTWKILPDLMLEVRACQKCTRSVIQIFFFFPSNPTPDLTADFSVYCFSTETFHAQSFMFGCSQINHWIYEFCLLVCANTQSRYRKTDYCFM